MRLFITTVTLWALVSAKPEMYKEKEDFQYSRSSSDDGSKSGYYGAQRGNMGGNFEKAHNMDPLAQHQMSTLVRQVDGELGEGANTRTGSVFTSGNSRGIYGSGNYDLSNLKGRNFEEGGGASYDDLYSSLISQNSRNNANSYTGINNARYSGHQLEATGLSAGYHHGSLASQYIQAKDNQQAESQHHGSSSNYQYGGQDASQYKYYTHESGQVKNEFDGSANLLNNNNYNANTKSRLISTTPQRIYVRPGTKVTIPIAAQTYDASHSSLSQQQKVVNTDADVLNHERHYVIKPVIVPKHYESSYNYHKEWEKHDSQPISIVPTENPFPRNSELYEEAQISGASGQQYQSEIDSTNILSSNIHSAQLSSLNNAQLSSLNSEQLSNLNRAHSNSLNSAHSNSLNSAHSSSLNSASSGGYSANAKSAASNRLRYLSQMQNAAEIVSSSDAHQSNMQNLGESNMYNNMNLVDDNSRPKSYQSSYSYHKSWERRGDPYIIKPAGSDISSQMSQKLVADSASYGTQAHSRYGSHYTQSQDDCVEPMRHKRSYNAHQYREHQFQQNQEAQDQQSELVKFGQQTDNKWESLENLEQQTQDKWDVIKKNYEHSQRQEQLGQQTQNSWGDLESFVQDKNQMGKLEDLGQQTQNSWADLESSVQDKNQMGKLEDLGQQTQNSWADLESSVQDKNQMRKLEDLGQQTQNSWGDLESFGQKNNPIGKLEDLGQQTQNSWADLESSVQDKNQMGKLEDLGQQTQNSWADLESSVQDKNQMGKLEDLGQQTQNSWGDLESFGQKNNPIGKLEDLGQQTQNSWADLESSVQDKNQMGKLEDLGQQTQNSWGDLESFGQKNNPIGKLEDLGQQTQNSWSDLESFAQHENKIGNLEDLSQQKQNLIPESHNLSGKLEDLNQQTQNTWEHLDNLSQQSQIGQLDLGQEIQNTWDHSEKLNQQTQVSKLEDFGQQTQKKEDNLDQSQIQLGKLDLGQQTQGMWDHIDTVSQQNQNEVEKLDDLGQQTQNSWGLDKFHPQSISQIEQLKNFDQETQSILDHNENDSHLDQSQSVANLEDLGQQTQTSWGSDSFHQQSQINQKDIKELDQETEKTGDNFEKLVPQTESKSYDQQGFNQHTQNGWNQFEDVNSQATRNMGKTSQDNIENGNPNIQQQEYVNLWENIFNFELQKNHDESTNINEQTQNTFWQHYSSNEQAFQEHSFNANAWHHSLHSPITEKSITQESLNNNNKNILLWDTIDKLIEESEKKEKNESQVYNNNYSSSNFNKGITTEKSITETTSYVSNENIIHEADIKNIGRGDIGPEDIREFSIDNNENSQESIELLNSPKESRVNNKLNKEKEHLTTSTSTIIPKQHVISDLNTQSILEQQNLEQQHEFIQQTNINDRSLLDFSQQAQKPTIEDVEVLSHSKFNQLEVQSHVSHEYQTDKFQNFGTKPKIINEQSIEFTTENPGFWKSVWGKTVNAKDTVVGWFKN